MVDFKILNQYLEKKLKPKNIGLYGRSPCRHPQAKTFQIWRCINHWTTTFRCSELRTNEAEIQVLIFLSWLSVLQTRCRCRSDRYSRNRWYSSTVAEESSTATHPKKNLWLLSQHTLHTLVGTTAASVTKFLSSWPMTVTLTNHKSTFYAFNFTSQKFTTFRGSLEVNNVSCRRRISRGTDDGNRRIHQEAREITIRKYFS